MAAARIAAFVGNAARPASRRVSSRESPFANRIFPTNLPNRHAMALTVTATVAYTLNYARDPVTQCENAGVAQSNELLDNTLTREGDVAALKIRIATMLCPNGDGSQSLDGLRTFYDIADADNNGSLTWDELQASLKQHGLTDGEHTTLEAMWKEMDNNGTGGVSRIEFVRFFVGPLRIPQGSLNRRVQRRATRVVKIQNRLEDESA